MQAILAIAAVAVICGARSFAAIGEWASDAPQWVLQVVGARWHQLQCRFAAPHEATLRRTIQAFDAQLLDAVICGWIAQQSGATADGARRPAIAVDGKVVCGAWRPDGSQVHLLSAISQDTAVVLAQREIAAKTNEIPELAALSADLDLNGVVVTADALHTQRQTARHLVADRGADYVMMTVKGNQPTLLAACQQALSGAAGDFAPEHVAFTTAAAEPARAQPGSHPSPTSPRSASLTRPRSSVSVATSEDWTASAPPRGSPTASPA